MKTLLGKVLRFSRDTILLSLFIGVLLIGLAVSFIGALAILART